MFSAVLGDAGGDGDADHPDDHKDFDDAKDDVVGFQHVSVAR